MIKDHKYASRDPEVTETLKTHNIPQPYKVKLIRTNVRFLNEPIVHVETDNTKDEQVPVALENKTQHSNTGVVSVYQLALLFKC